MATIFPFAFLVIENCNATKLLFIWWQAENSTKERLSSVTNFYQEDREITLEINMTAEKRVMSHSLSSIEWNDEKNISLERYVQILFITTV